MQHHQLTSLLVAALPVALLAQVPVPLSGTYQIGSITTETFSGSCTPNAPVHAVLDTGTAIFQPGGTALLSLTTYEVCPGGNCTTAAGASTTNYHVTPEGYVLFDDNPGAPGEDWGLAFLRSDASVLMFGRWTEQEDEPYLGVLVARSSGQGPGSLSGDYGFVRYVVDNGGSTPSMRSDYGTLTFNGNGAFTEAAQQHPVVWNGAASQSTPFVGAGGYAVANDGLVTIVGGGTGAVSSDREFVFWVRQSCPEVEMVLAVRKPAVSGPIYVAGDWRLTSAEVDVVADTLESDWGTINLTPTSATAGSLDPTVFHVSTVVSPGGTTTGSTWWNVDTYSLGGNGAVTLFASATQRRPVPGWLSRDGSVLVGAPGMPGVGVSSPTCGISMALTRCTLPSALGAGTAGTGGLAPLLLSFGGYPHAANTNFGFVVASGLGGAPGLLLLSGGVVATALPVAGFGLWLDPTLLGASQTIVLSGPPGLAGVGAAGLPWPLPASPGLAGVLIGAQAVVLDPLAPGGLAASGAVAFVLGR